MGFDGVRNLELKFSCLAGDPGPKVNNLESDRNSKHILILPFLDVTPTVE
jgi:hypothetical protein